AQWPRVAGRSSMSLSEPGSPLVSTPALREPASRRFVARRGTGRGRALQLQMIRLAKWGRSLVMLLLETRRPLGGSPAGSDTCSHDRTFGAKAGNYQSTRANPA